MPVPVERFFLFLGATDSESATSRLRADSTVYYKKMLQSRPKNWQQILILLRAPTLQGVLATFTGNDYERMLATGYETVSVEVLDSIAAVPHVVFVHEAVFFSDEERPSVEGDSEVEGGSDDDPGHDLFRFMPPEEYFGRVPDDVRRQVNEMLIEREINVVPYRTNAERSILATAFLDDHERHLLFRVYVPSGRLYANEADTLLGLFREWLGQTGRNAIRQDGYRTAAGQVYEFFGKEAQAAGDLTRQFQDFSDFLDACVDRPETAAAQLEAAGIETRVANRLVVRYGKATRRLHLDLRQTREERLLGLRHELESELLDQADVRSSDVLALLERWIPPVTGGALGILVPEVSAGAAAANAGAGVQVTITQQLIGQVAGNVIQNVQGTVNLGPEAKDLLAIIGQFGGAKRVELESAVYELEDPDARTQDRLAARQKLRRFLSSLGTRVADMALSTLHKYLEQRIGVG
jgi:hypothetical protein